MSKVVRKKKPYTNNLDMCEKKIEILNFVILNR